MADYDYELRATIPRILVEVVPGEALSVTVPILDSAGAPVAVANAALWSALAMLRAQWSSADLLHTFTTVGGSPNASVTQGSAGAVVLAATAAVTAAWQAAWAAAPPTAVADLFVTDNAGVPHCIADLVVTLLPRNTR